MHSLICWTYRQCAMLYHQQRSNIGSGWIYALATAAECGKGRRGAFKFEKQISRGQARRRREPVDRVQILFVHGVIGSHKSDQTRSSPGVCLRMRLHICCAWKVYFTTQTSSSERISSCRQPLGSEAGQISGGSICRWLLAAGSRREPSWRVARGKVISGELH